MVYSLVHGTPHIAYSPHVTGILYFLQKVTDCDCVPVNMCVLDLVNSVLDSRKVGVGVHNYIFGVHPFNYTYDGSSFIHKPFSSIG